MQSTAVFGSCLFSGSTNYTVFLEDITGMVVEERTVGSDRCNDNCSITVKTSILICLVKVVAKNELGESNMTSADVG